MKKAWIVYFLAFLIGSIYIYPDIRLIHELGSDYQRITMTAAGDELLYLGMVNTFYKGGNFTLSGFDNYEHTGQPWTFGFLPEVILGSIGKMLRISVTDLDILMSFVLPALLFILIYLLSLRLSASENLSLIASAAILLGYHLFTSKVVILKDVLSLGYSQALWFLRPISPQANHVVLILALLFIYIALTSGRSLLLWLSALTLGLLSYTFPYSWVFVYAGLFAMAFIFIIRKEFSYIRHIVFILFLSFIISTPYLINVWKLVHFPGYANMLRLLNIIYTHQPILPLSHIFLTIIILSLYFGKKHDFNFYYISGFIIAGWLCLNQQVISGRVLLPDHWQGYTNKTFLIIALFASLENLKENNLIRKMIKYVSLKRFAVALALVILTLSAFKQQDNFFNKNKAFYQEKQSLSRVYAWLRGHTDKNDVVLTDPFNYMIREDIPEPFDILVYAYNFSFSPLTNSTMRSTEELEDRHLLSLAVLGYGQDQARQFITFRNGLNFLSMGAVEEYEGKGITQEYVAYLENKYKSLQSPQGLLSVLRKYRLNYILVRKNTAIEKGILYKEGMLSMVYDDGKFVIFKLNRPGTKDVA